MQIAVVEQITDQNEANISYVKYISVPFTVISVIRGNGRTDLRQLQELQGLSFLARLHCFVAAFAGGSETAFSNGANGPPRAKVVRWTVANDSCLYTVARLAAFQTTTHCHVTSLLPEGLAEANQTQPANEYSPVKLE